MKTILSKSDQSIHSLPESDLAKEKIFYILDGTFS